MHGMMDNPHAPLVPGVVSVVTWLSGVQPLLASILTVLTIAWYVRLFWKDWRDKK